MMRFITPLLAKLWPLAPLPPVEPMDFTHMEARASDPIANALDAAVDAHERAAIDAQTTYAKRIRAATDELLDSLAKREKRNG